jgi:hypothetical protein
MDEHVATILFIDGAWRTVYEDADGRPYVIDGNGDKAYGVWFIPPGEPMPTDIVNALVQRNAKAAGDFPCPRFAAGYAAKGGGGCERERFTTALVAPPVSTVRPRHFSLPFTSRGDRSRRIALA